MILRLAYISAFFMLFAHSNALASSGLACPQISPRVIVQEQERPIEFVRHLSSVELTRMQKRKGIVPHSSVSFVQGLGGGSITLAGKVIFSIYGDDVERCVAVKSVDGAIISAPLVHIASNYPKGSCEYNAVLEHELMHVDILNEFRTEYAPKFKYELQRLINLAAPAGPMPRAQVKATQNRKHEIIERGIQRYADEITNIMQRRQVAIDTKEEYARTHSQCNNWDETELAFEPAYTAPAPTAKNRLEPRPVYNVTPSTEGADTRSLYERYPPQIPAHRRTLYNQ